MSTLTRVSTFSGDLGETVKRYDLRFMEVRWGLGNNIKYGLYVPNPNPNFMMVSKARDEKINSFGYNFILSITSDQDSFNLDLARQFREKTGIDLREAPDWLASNFQMLDCTFEMFKRRGPEVMDVLF